MHKGRIQFHVARSPAEVFPYIMDLERAPEWLPDVVSVEKLTPGEIGIGTRYRQVMQLGGKRVGAEVEVCEFEPDRVIAHRGRGTSAAFAGTFSGRFTLVADAGGTAVAHEYTFELSGVMRLLAPAVNAVLKRNVEAGIARLERALKDPNP